MGERQSTLNELWENSRKNVVPIRELRRFAGNANHVVTVIYTWRPFLGGASFGPPVQGDVGGGVALALQFLAAFLDGQNGAPRRRFTQRVQAHAGPGLALDESRWVIGAVLVVSGKIREWTAGGLTKHDEELLGHPLGSAEC